MSIKHKVLIHKQTNSKFSVGQDKLFDEGVYIKFISNNLGDMKLFEFIKSIV